MIPLLALMLVWDANRPEDKVTHYNVYESTNLSSGFQFIGSTTNTFYPIEFLDGAHFFYVTAVNAAGESGAP